MRTEGIEIMKEPDFRFSDLLDRQRELPFGQKLQNHALNHRFSRSQKH